jgi:hypothetical protein
VSLGREQFIDALNTIKAEVSGRSARRRQVANLVSAAQEWLTKFDSQEASAAADFAASKPTQFSAFVDALPDVVVDPNDPVP